MNQSDFSSSSPSSTRLHGSSSTELVTQPLPPQTRIAFIQSSWHEDIVSRGRAAFLAEMSHHGVASDAIDLFQVPGAFEIPLLAKKLAQTGQFDAIIACAVVVNGGIYRHEFVSAAVIDGLMRVQLDSEVPIFSAVLTPRDFHEHSDHIDFFRAHFVKKGEEVANACLSALHQLALVESLNHKPVQAIKAA